MRFRRVDTIFEYLEHVSTIQRDHHLWFRGVASADYRLVPGLIRRDQVGLEGNYVQEFLVAFRAYVDRVPESPWDVYGLMQHHGLPTRLLDWTSSPLYALFFALTQDPDLNTDRVVWVLPPHELNRKSLGVDGLFCPGAMASRKIETPFGNVDLDAYLPQALDSLDHRSLPDKPIAIEAPLTHARVRAQRGCFTVHGTSREPIDSYFTDADSEPYLAHFVLNTRGRLNAFLDPLRDWRIDEETVYQDLDSLAKRIRRELGGDSS
jgi:hypothetical protein